MDRQTFFAYEAPLETDFLYGERFAYEGLGLLAMDLLGTASLVSGLGCVPTTPASLQVKMQPGRLYSVQNLEPTAWATFNGFGLPIDNNADHNILKQGIYRDTTTLATMPAPVTPGQSINYLVEAAFSEVDGNSQSVNFVSSTSPYPPIAPSTLNTTRLDQVVITVKAGTPATTGSQTTPAVDAGNVGLYVVTVANGQSTITAGNISVYGGAPFITETLTQKISQTTGDSRYVRQVNGRIKLSAGLTLYVATTGSDTTGDGSVGNPYRTAQKASDVLQSSYDLSGNVVTISRAAGTYTDGVTVNGPYVGATQGAGAVIFDGAGLASTIVNAGGNTYTANFGASFTVQNQKLTSSGGGGFALSAANNGNINYTNIDFGSCANSHINSQNSSNVKGTGNYTISAGAPNAHIQLSLNSAWTFNGGTVTITGSPGFATGAFILCGQNSTVNSSGTTWSGSATGSRYLATLNGVINTSGAGATYFPGNAAGATASGGQYA